MFFLFNMTVPKLLSENKKSKEIGAVTHGMNGITHDNKVLAKSVLLGTLHLWEIVAYFTKFYFMNLPGMYIFVRTVGTHIRIISKGPATFFYSYL